MVLMILLILVAPIVPIVTIVPVVPVVPVAAGFLVQPIITAPILEVVMVAALPVMNLQLNADDNDSACLSKLDSLIKTGGNPLRHEW